MAAVLQFRRKSAPGSWVNDELAEFYRIVDVMGRAGLAISVDVGVSDEGEPWVAFLREDTGDVLAHIARIDGWVVAVSAASPEVVRAQSLKEVVRRIVDTHPLVLLPAHRPGAHIHVHPCAVLAAFITAAYLLAEGVQSEAHARDYAATVAADAAAAATISLKPAPHPNPLRSALTSISDFLRGVGDLAQPVTVNSASASAAIAAVVAFVFAGDDNGVNASHRVELAAAQHDTEAALQAAAQIADQSSKMAEQGAAQSVVGLSLDRDDAEAAQQPGAPMAMTRHVAIEVESAQAQLTTVAAHEQTAAAAPTDAVTHSPAPPAELADRVHVDAAIMARLALVDVAVDRAVKSGATETISTVLSTVAGPTLAAKGEAVAAPVSLAATATARSTDATADHATAAAHSASQNADYLVVRLSDLSKTAIDALRLTDLSARAAETNAVSTATSSANLADATTNSSGFTFSSTGASTGGSTSASTQITDASHSLATNADPAAISTVAPSIVATTGKKTDAVTDGLLRASAPGTETTQTQSVETSTGPSAHQIISSIVDFAYGTDMMLSASTLQRASIQSDLAAHGLLGSGQKVLVFSSDSVKVSTFEFTPGIVMMERSELSSATGDASLLPSPMAGKIIDLADGAAIRLVGVIDLSVTA